MPLPEAGSRSEPNPCLNMKAAGWSQTESRGRDGGGQTPVQGVSGRANSLLQDPGFSLLLRPGGQRRNRAAKVCAEQIAARPRCQDQRGHPGIPSPSPVCAGLCERRVPALLRVLSFQHVCSPWHSREGVRCSLRSTPGLPQPCLGLGRSDRWAVTCTLLPLLFYIEF